MSGRTDGRDIRKIYYEGILGRDIKKEGRKGRKGCQEGWDARKEGRTGRK